MTKEWPHQIDRKGPTLHRDDVFQLAEKGPSFRCVGVLQLSYNHVKLFPSLSLYSLSARHKNEPWFFHNDHGVRQ